MAESTERQEILTDADLERLGKTLTEQDGRSLYVIIPGGPFHRVLEDVLRPHLAQAWRQAHDDCCEHCIGEIRCPNPYEER